MGLRVGDRGEDEGTLCKHHIHDVHPASICGRVNIANCLVQQKEVEASEACDGEIRWVAFGTLILVIDDALEGKPSTKEHGIRDATQPRRSLE